MSAPVDYGLLAQKAAEEHLEACMAALYADPEDREYEENFPEWPEDMAGPFCGCETCFVREVLHAAWPIFLQSQQP